MADAFKGLTIRLGADARPLNSALYSITKSAKDAQKQLRMMQQALKTDAYNAKSLGFAFDLANDKAQLIARSLVTTKTAINQAENSMVRFTKSSGLASGKIKNVASDVKNVYAVSQRLISERTHANAQLEMIWNRVAQIYADTNNLSVKSKEVAKHTEYLKNNYSAAKNEIHSLVGKAAQLDDMSERFGVSGSSLQRANQLWGLFNRLRNESRGLQKDMQALAQVEGFRAMQYKAQALAAELKEAALEAVKFKTQMFALESGEGLSKAKADAERLTSELELVSNEAREARDASKAIPSNFKAAQNAVRATKAQQELLKESIKRYESILDKIRSNTAFDIQKARTMDAATALNRAEHAAADLKVKLDVAEESQNRLNAELKDAKNTSFIGPVRSIKSIEKELEKATADVEKFRAEYKKAESTVAEAAMYREFQKAENVLNRLNAEMAELKTRLSVASTMAAAFRNIRTMGYGLYSTITPAIMIAGRYALQAAEEIDAAYRDMRKTVNGTEQEFEHLKEAALEFSRTHVTTADTILEIEALGGQLGIAANNLEGFAEVVSNLDIATNMDSETIATNLGQLSNIMWDIRQHKNDPIEYQKSITSFSDALVRLGNNSAAQESNIMKIMMRIASLGSISGFTTPQLLAISTAVAATGQGAEAAGTAIARTFSNIEAAVGAGGDELARFAEISGMSAEEFAEAWNGDPIRAFDAFIAGLKQIDKEGGSVDNTLANLGINSVRQKQALEGLTTTYDILTNSIQMSNEAWEGQISYLSDGSIEMAGDAAREAQRKSEGFSGAMKIMENNAKYLAMELADGAYPIIKDLGTAFMNLTEWLKSLSPEMKTFAIQVAGVVAAIGPASIAIGAVGSSLSSMFAFLSRNAGKRVFGNLSGEVFGIAKAGISASSGLGKFSALLGGLTWGKLAVGAAAFAALATAVSIAYEKFMEYKTAVTDARKLAIDTAPRISSFSGDFERLGANVGNTTMLFGEFIKKQANLVTGIKERNEAAQDEIDTLQEAREVLRTQMNQTNDTAEAQGRLRAAVDKVNEICGTQYSVVDSLNGKIADEKGVLQDTIQGISDYIAKKEALIRLETYEADLTDALTAKRLAAAQVAQALKDVEAAKTTTNLADDDIAAQEALDHALEAYNAISDTVVAYEGLIGRISDGNKLLSQDWEATFSNTDAFVQFQDSLAKLGVDFDLLNSKSIEDIAKAVYAWESGGQSISEVIASLGLDMEGYQKTLSDVMANSGISFDAFAASFGKTSEEMAQALLLSGIGWETMSNIGQEKLNELVTAANGDISTLIALLQEVQNNPVEVSTDAATAEVEQLTDAAETYASGEYDPEADVESEGAQAEWDELTDTAEEYDGSNYSASASLNTYPADTALSNLISRLNEFSNRTWSASVSANTSGGNAAGGIWGRSIAAVPAHAAGSINGIVTRPTMTNVGLTGEAGDEAILHLRHAGGAIIPLSNRQHVRPFARAVASEMWGPGSSGTTTIYNISLSDFAINDDVEIRAATDDYIRTLARKAAMNRG